MFDCFIRFLFPHHDLTFFTKKLAAPFQKKTNLRVLLRYAGGLLAIVVLHADAWAQPCPTLSQASTLTSPDCAAGITPCTVCPGDQITLNTTGTGLQPGDCVNWYYGTTPNFNPYAGQGTLMGCAEIQPAPVNPCGSCPQVLALFVNACGTEENNEIIAMLSGSGFAVNDLEVTFDPSVGGNIGTDCAWQEPSSNAISSIQTICPGATVVGAGPGETVPPNVPLIVFTSAGYDFNYNFGSLCPISPVIYVMQNGCTRTDEAFPNSGPNVTTTVSLTCGCGSTMTYNPGLLTGGNGAFVAAPPPPFPIIYGNASCGFPPLGGGGGGGGGSSAIVVPPFTYTITEDMCNGGPYYAVGIVEPLPAGCPPASTNAIPFNVPCPTPTLEAGPDLCQNSGNFDLSDLEDPAVPNGGWSGPGVAGGFFNPASQLGEVTLTFTPTGSCGIPATTTIRVFSAPTAVFLPVTPICAGQTANLVLNFAGQPPFSFDLYGAGNFLNSYITSDNTITIPVTPTGGGATAYSTQNFGDAVCMGFNPSVIVPVTQPTTATLSISGPNAVCQSGGTTFAVDFAAGNPPFVFTPQVNGVNQVPITSQFEPVFFSLNLATPGNVTVTATNASTNGCNANVSGSVIVAVTAAPTATLLLSPKTLCAGQADTLVVNVSGSGALSLVVEANGMALPPVAATAPVTLIPVSPGVGINAYRLLSLTGGTCPGVVSGVDTTTVLSNPTAFLSGNATFCGTNNPTIPVQVTGVGPISVTATSNVPGVPNISMFGTAPTISLPVFPISGTYTLVAVSASGCSGTATGSAQVIFQNPPTATLSGGGSLCLDGNGDSLTVNFTGNGSWTFVYSVNDIAQPAITTTQNPYRIFVNPVGYTLYKLESVSNANCGAGTVGGTAEVFVYAPSAVTLADDLSFCNSVSTTLSAAVSGTAPFIITYAINGVNQPTDTINEGPYLIPVSISQSTTYSMVSIQSPGCVGLAQGSATITINEPPQYTNLTPICNPASGTYVMTFEVLNAALPLTLVSGSGSFSGITFTSTPIPLASGYSFVFRDANNCGDVTVAGPSTCNCATQSGSMVLTPINLCAGQTATAQHNANQQLDGSDILRFILQTNQALPLGNILAWSSTPSFPYSPAFEPGTTYYISAIAGNDNGAGQVDLNDPCRSVSPGTPVLWRPLPDLTLAADTLSACAGDSVSVLVNLVGTPPFSIQYSLDGMAQDPLVGIPSSSFIFKIATQNTATLVVEAMNDQFCADAQNGDELLIEIRPTPVATNVVTTCQPNSQEYLLEFDVSNGLAPFDVQGVGGAFSTATHFVSSPIASGAPYFVTLGDANQCGLDTLVGVRNCNCTTEAGTMPSDTTERCAEQAVSLPPSVGATLDPNDVLVYFLTTDPVPANGQTLAVNTTPTFSFDPATMLYGATYFVVAAVANQSPTGGVDLFDGCLDFSNATPVLWRPPVSGTISGTDTICVGSGAFLNVALTGGGLPYTYILAQNNTPQAPQTATGPMPGVLVTPSLSSSYTLLSVSVGGCSGAGTGSASVLVEPAPAVSNLFVECDPNGQTFTLRFDISNGGLPNPTYTVSGVNGTLSDTTFTSEPLPEGTSYSVVVSTPEGCSTTLSGTGTCACSTDAGALANPANACVGDSVSAQIAVPATLDPNDTLAYVLCQNPATLPLGIIAVNPEQPIFGFQNGMVAGQTYFIAVVAGNALTSGTIDPGDPCLSVSAGVPVRFFEQPNATFATPDTTVCVGNNVTLGIALTGQPPFQLNYLLNGVPQPTPNILTNQFQISLLNVLTDQVFQLVSVSNANCSRPLTDSVLVTAQALPQAILSGSATICPTDSAVLTIRLLNVDNANVAVFQNGANPLTFNDITDGFNFVVSPSATTIYTFGLVFAPGNTCPLQAEGTVVVDIQDMTSTATLSGFNGFEIACAFGDNGTATVVPQGGGGQYVVKWDDGVEGATRTGLSAGIYAYTVTDQNGCDTEGQVQLEAPDELTFDFLVENPLCFDQNTGQITLVAAEGGVGDLTWRIDNQPARPADVLPDAFQNLAAGTYEVVVSDANGCSLEESVNIDSPPPFVVDLGPDQSIVFGDSLLLSAMTATDVWQSLRWSPLESIRTPDALQTWSQPFATTQFVINLVDTFGCVATDEMLVTVRRDRRVYIPTAIAPDLANGNSVLTVFAGSEVRQVRYLRVYDRWGGLIFKNENFLPNDPAQGWDGTIERSSTARASHLAVYVWTTEIEYVDGTTEVISGDVTVVR
jgi:hypothetical protein